MLRMNGALLRKELEQLSRAIVDHTEWRDHLLRVISGRQPVAPQDTAADAHRRCLFGQWYFEQARPALRELQSFAMLGAEHEAQHRIAAELLRNLAVGANVGRTQIEEFEDASARLSYAFYFLRREIECALHDRDVLTDAHNPEAMLRDLLEWHAVAGQPGRQCCIAVMALDAATQDGAPRGHSPDNPTLIIAVNAIAAQLRLTDKVFRHRSNRFLIRLAGTDLAAGKRLIMRLRETITNEVAVIDADGVAFSVTASFGLALLDPAVEVQESVERADHALTLARTAGRNRVIVWDPSVTTGVRLRRLELKDIEG